MLEALGNRGDFISGLAVIASLTYVAVEVRQSTLQLKRASTRVDLRARDATFEGFSRFRGLNLTDLLRQPGLVQWWEANEGSLPDDFIAIVDSEIQGNPQHAVGASG